MKNGIGKQGAKARVLAELHRHGRVGVACKAAKISRPTFYRWRGDDSQFDRDCNAAIKISKGEA